MFFKSKKFNDDQSVDKTIRRTDQSNVFDDYVVIDNVTINKENSSDYLEGKLDINETGIFFESSDIKNSFEYLFNSDELVRYGVEKGKVIRYYIDEFTFIRDQGNTNFLFERACEMIEKRNQIAKKRKEKLKLNEINSEIHEDFYEYKFELIEICNCSMAVDETFYYGSIFLEGRDVRFVGKPVNERLDQLIVKELREWCPVTRSFKYEYNYGGYGVLWIDQTLFALQGTEAQTKNEWLKVDEYYSYYDSIMKQRNDFLNTEVDAIIDDQFDEYRNLFNNFIKQSNFDIFLDMNKLVTLELYINSVGEFIPFNFYYRDLQFNNSIESLEDGMNIDDIQYFYDNHYKQLLKIVSRKLQPSKQGIVDLFALKCLRLTLIDYYATEFEKTFNPSILNVNSIDEYIEEYFKENQELALYISNLGRFTYYLISKNLVNPNYVISMDELVIKLNVIIEHYKLNLYEAKLNMSADNKSYFLINDIDLMDGHEFEHFVSLLFIKMGYSSYVTKGSGDQGIDVIAEKNGKKIGIQAKCYSGNVSNGAIQEVVAGITHYKLDKAIVVTNSNFTQSARELAQSNNVILWDREILKEKIAVYQVETN